MKTTRPSMVLAALPLAGCGVLAAPSSGETVSIPSSVDVAWGPIPSPDGGSLGVVLEPRVWASSQAGWLVTEAAPALVVSASGIGGAPGSTVDTLSRGMTSTQLGPTSAWILQATTTTSWTVLSYGESVSVATDAGLYGLCNGSAETSDAGADASFSECDGVEVEDYQPLPSFTQVTRVDRSSLGVTGSRPLVPPVWTPVVVSDDVLVGLPAMGPSDIVRDVSIVAYGPDASIAPTVVYGNGGYGVASCSGASFVALAFEPAGALGTTTIVSAVLSSGAWQTQEMTLPHVRPGVAMACNADGSRVLVTTVGASSAVADVMLLDLASGTVVTDAPGLAAPLALSSDGQSGVAASTTDMTLWRVDASGTTALEGGPSLATSPLQSGDLALFALQGGYALVHLTDGTLEAQLAPVAQQGIVSPVPWTAGNGFVVPVIEPDATNYDPQLTHLYVVTAGHKAELPLGHVIDNPALVVPAGNTLFVQTEFTGLSGLDTVSGAPIPSSPPNLLSYDLTTRTLTSETVFPTCDPEATLADAGCSP